MMRKESLFMRYDRLCLGGLLLVLILLSVTPVLAAPSMTLTPIWRPGEQLSSLASEDAPRYVDVQLLATGNVQFWAVNLTCAFSPAVLEGYTYDSTDTTLDPGDDIPMVTWGPDWGTDFVAVGSDPFGSGGQFDFDPGSGKLTLRASRLGNVPPLGINGADYTLMVASLRLRVKDLGDVYKTFSASVKCSPIEFLDRDGRTVARAKQAKTANLTVRTGYSISGLALLQGAKNHSGIQVECTNVAAPAISYVATTNSKGSYVFGGGGDLIREFGAYNCVFASPVSSPQAEFLRAQVDLNLNSVSYFLLPVILKGGNINVAPGSLNDIDDMDLSRITAEWAPGTVAAPYDGLDINGDRRVSEADLAILAGNYDPQDDDAALVSASHVLYGLATDYEGTFPNSRTYWGDAVAGAVQLLENPKRERDFWPSMAPDGETVVFSRLVSKTNQYVLMTSPAAKPKGRQITPKGYGDQALAPAWSPDGQRIAFVCSWLGATSGYEFNQGDICVIDVNGGNLQKIAYSSRIYPPAWYDNNVLIYAGLPNHSDELCRRNLCFVDLATNRSGPVALLPNDANDVADMPGIGSLFDGTSETKVLFYRFFDGTSTSIRAHEITSYDSGTGSFIIGPPITAATSSPGNHIDYYDVSPFMNVMYYESNVTSGVFRALDDFYNLRFAEDGTPGLSAADWADVVMHRVDGFVGSPVAQSGLGGTGTEGAPWNGSLVLPTRFHAQRATFDWIP